jgi:hypothetical protein
VGIIIGIAAGAAAAYFFILPGDILNLKLSAMTIGDVLRIIGAFVATVITAGIGFIIDTLNSDQ